jgi:hypothetical protein
MLGDQDHHRDHSPPSSRGMMSWPPRGRGIGSSNCGDYPRINFRRVLNWRGRRPLQGGDP